MIFEIKAAFSLTIGIGAAIGWWRFKKTEPAFFPFLLLLTLGFCNEVVSIVLVTKGYKNINYNYFELVESLILAWQFLKWGLFERRKYRYYLLQAVFIALWVTENFKHSFQFFNSYFILAHSFLLMLVSISMINRTSLSEPAPLWQQPIFLICTGLLIFYNYEALVETFLMFGAKFTSKFRNRISDILIYIVLLTNLLFAG